MLGLTREERKVVLFLISVALVGVGADFFIKKYAPLKASAGFTVDLGKVNLNTADRQVLMDIPGIGEKLALRILEYRDKQAGFSSLEALHSVKGISEAKFEKIKEYLFVK